MLIIAEIGQNHNGDIGIAQQLIYAAKKNGAHIAKFQLYDVDSIFPSTFEWYREAKEAQLTKEHVIRLAKECERAGIEFMASVFDLGRVQWCEEVGMKRYKIASRSIFNQPLIETVLSCGKDVIISLGMWKKKSLPRIKGRGRVDFLYCVPKYPTELEDVDFLQIDFNEYSGFSDHTIGIEAALVAIARGARIIEKHFTLDKTMHGPDHACSMEPSELRNLARHAQQFERVLYHV